MKTDFDAFVRLNDNSTDQRDGTKFAEHSVAWRNAYHNDIEALSNNYFRPSPALTSKQIAMLVIDSLHFHQIRDRSWQIRARPAYPETFTWIFEKNRRDESLGSGFAEWLEQRDSCSLYWIAGCPGSGKSTLMHFLSDACQTEAILASWKGSKKLLTASSFFWLSGSPLQKSFTGLLRSLLHDLFKQGPMLVQQSASWRWRSIWLGATSLPDWSNRELIDTFCRLTKAAASTNNCIFLLIDGLDEFDGSEAERVELVDSLAAWALTSCVKICASSRPWPVFQSAFESGPHLRLEKLTRGDISLYVNEKFEKLRAFQDFTLLYPKACQALTQEIEVKAQGVFLWVYLVVASLSRGMEDGLSMKQLQDKLGEMPGDLETYFRNIILAIPERYRSVAATHFSLLMNVRHHICLLSLCYIEMEDPESTQKYGQPEILEAIKRVVARRLESHCGGLIQVIENSDSGIYRDRYVDFLHRTVRDFLASENTQQILQANLPTVLEPLSILCRSVQAQLETIDSEHEDTKELARDFLHYASELETQSHCADINLIERYFSQVHSHLLRSESDRQQYGSLGSVLTDAIQWRLTSFAKTMIDTRTIDFNGIYSGFFSESRNPLLRHCFPSGAHVMNGQNLDDLEGVMPQDTVIAALLAKGADPNQEINDRTIWDSFLEEAKAIRNSPNGTVSILDNQSWFRTAKLFIENGASATGQLNPFSGERADFTEAVEHIFRGEDGARLAKLLRDQSSVRDIVGRKKGRTHAKPVPNRSSVEDVCTAKNGTGLAKALRNRSSAKGLLKRVVAPRSTRKE